MFQCSRLFSDRSLHDASHIDHSPGAHDRMRNETSGSTIPTPARSGAAVALAGVMGVMGAMGIMGVMGVIGGTIGVMGGSVAAAAQPTPILDDEAVDPSTERATLPDGVRVIITEIMYDPASTETRSQPEWVEIANLGTKPIEIRDWRLDDEDTRPVDQWGPFSCTLLPGQVAVLINGDHVTEEEFRRAWDPPAGESAEGDDSEHPYLVIPVKWGNLANNPSATNEILVLRDGENRIVCEVNFQSGNGWPRLRGVGGPSIYLIDLDATDLNDGANWRASVVGEDGARQVRPTEIFDGPDVGSPGRLPSRRPASARGAAPATDGAS